MPLDPSLGKTLRKPLRVWPGVLAVVLLLAARFGVKMVVPGFAGFRDGMLVSLGLAAVVVLWWLLLSRARWLERLGGVLLLAGGLAATRLLAHESMGPFWLLAYALPFLLLAFVAWAVATRRLADRVRWATLIVAVVAACGPWLAARSEGITGDHVGQFAWRWTETADDRARFEELGDPAAAPAVEETVASEGPAWPGFRGPRRDGRVPSVRIGTDWSADPPVELWRRPVGPGWSSFAVRDGRLYTQEQRGDEELVSCYDLATGTPLWHHRDPVRFFEANAGAGPRATPAVSGRRVVALGATGLLNALDAVSGDLLWSRDVTADTGVPVPDWGFSGSPLIADDLAVVAVSGRLAGYELASGQPRWLGETRGLSYSSPTAMTISGVPQVVQLSQAGVSGVAAVDGTALWHHPAPGFPIVQPAALGGAGLLYSVSQEQGTRRLAVHRGPNGDWMPEEGWSSSALKPYFNDFVLHEGHVYGFDGRILAAVDLESGERRWKGGRYGSGQMVLLSDQDLLLVLSETGELALVSATPERFTELARMPVLEGKTWNHPVVVGDVLLVRNGAEMAAFRLPAPGA